MKVMVKFRGTQGKWKTSKYSINELRIISDQGADVAVLDNFMNGFGKHENKANAKLIAAAPEMLDFIIRISQHEVFSGNKEIEYIIKKATE